MLPSSEAFGHSFEHFIIQELIAYLDYTRSTEKLTYWRTSSGYEVDARIGEGRIAIEIKSIQEVNKALEKPVLLRRFPLLFNDFRIQGERTVAIDFLQHNIEFP